MPAIRRVGIDAGRGGIADAAPQRRRAGAGRRLRRSARRWSNPDDGRRRPGARVRIVDKVLGDGSSRPTVNHAEVKSCDKFANLSGQLATISPPARVPRPALTTTTCHQQAVGSTGNDAETMAYGCHGHRVPEVWWGMLGAARDGRRHARRVPHGAHRRRPRIRAALSPYQRASLTAAITGYHLRWWDASQVFRRCCVEGGFGRRSVAHRPAGRCDGTKAEDRRAPCATSATRGPKSSSTSSAARCLAGIVPTGAGCASIARCRSGPRRRPRSDTGGRRDLRRDLAPWSKPHKATPPELRSTPRARLQAVRQQGRRPQYGRRVVGGVETSDPCPGCDDGWIEAAAPLRETTHRPRCQVP